MNCDGQQPEQQYYLMGTHTSKLSRHRLPTECTHQCYAREKSAINIAKFY